MELKKTVGEDVLASVAEIELGNYSHLEGQSSDKIVGELLEVVRKQAGMIEALSARVNELEEANGVPPS